MPAAHCGQTLFDMFEFAGPDQRTMGKDSDLTIRWAVGQQGGDICVGGQVAAASQAAAFAAVGGTRATISVVRVRSGGMAGTCNPSIACRGFADQA
jgi:hypothetical protein